MPNIWKVDWVMMSAWRGGGRCGDRANTAVKKRRFEVFREQVQGENARRGGMRRPDTIFDRYVHGPNFLQNVHRQEHHDTYKRNSGINPG